jgi:hypothetical protein
VRCTPAPRETLPIEGKQARGFPEGGAEVREGVQTEEQASMQAVKVNPHLVASTFFTVAVINSGYLPLYPVAIGYWMLSMHNSISST